MPTLDDYRGQFPAWCPGCGNFGILKAFKEAFVELGLEPYQFTIVSGVGQAGKFPHYVKCNTFNGLHGRTLPVATGAKLANHELTVLAVGGDGDGYAEGGNHFIHAMRRNIDITYLVHNNQVYGLTKGQTSPTSELGYVSRTTPSGSPAPPMTPLLLAIATNCSFVARGFSGNKPHLTDLIKAAITHKGFAFVEILQPCVSFNRVNTFGWYKDRVYSIDDDEEYDPTNRNMAFERAQEWGERIPTGLLYLADRPTRDGKERAIREVPLVKQRVANTSFPKILEPFK